MQINKISFDLANITEKLTFLLPFIFILIIIYKWLLNTLTNNKHLPPSPPKLPIIGNLHQLGKFPHRSLRSLSHKHGELMLLYLGNCPTLVVSSADAAKEVMKTHDVIFSNRPQLRFIERIFNKDTTVAFTPYGEKWRYMKSICMMQLLSNKNVHSFRRIREEEVELLIEEIKPYDGLVLNLSETFHILFKDIVSRTAFGRKYTVEGGIGTNGTDFHQLFKELIRVIGEPSIGDIIPLLGWIDKLSGLESRVEIVRKKFNDFSEEVIQEHQIRRNNQQNFDKEDDVKDFVEVLLDVQRENPEKLSRDDIKGLILDMFVAGTGTASTALEWAMTELIRHPEVMKKLQEEVKHVTKTKTRVSEDDLENMKYLKVVIKETLRLHPPVSIIFRESSQDIEINNYNICARTQVFINVWAIQRDPKIWKDPEVFYPERFLQESSSIDFRGQHLHLIPFGAGRRSCPGLSFGMVNVELVLATLVREFNWTLPNGREGDTLDVAESVGITVGRQNPLMLIATPTPPNSCN